MLGSGDLASEVRDVVGVVKVIFFPLQVLVPVSFCAGDRNRELGC